MGQVVANASMSLDGYIAKQDNTIGRLFDWLQNGDVELRTVDDRITFHLSPASAEYWRTWVDGLGALVCGRTLFDFTGGTGVGEGRPFFGEIKADDVLLGDPSECVQGDRVTHLRFPVTESSTQSSEGRG